MFGVTERFSAKKGASLLRSHHTKLRREHAKLRVLLRRRSNRPNLAEISEQRARLEMVYRESMIASIQVCRRLARRISAINLGAYADAIIANSRLFSTHQKVAKTLRQLVPQQDTKGH